MNKAYMPIVIGAVLGMIVGRMLFNGFESMGWSMFWNEMGEMSIGDVLGMGFFSSGALKIWGGAIVGGVLGRVYAKRSSEK